MTESNSPDSQALLKKALIELRNLRKQVHTLKRRQHEPIAVVGMACRFPGGCDTPQAYWDLLREGRSGIREVPRDRWDIDAYYDPDPDAEGKIYTRYGGYIDKIDGFDNAFFGISPKEAGSMDPQQRLVLEVAWEALEHAGINPQSLYGSQTGVFLGIGNWEHAVLRFGMENPQNINAYTGTGSCGCVASGRISFALGLKGPNFAVDTACSSSLLSTHLACQSLRRGECDMALAGGSHLLLTPGMTICFCRARMLAPDGRCKTFDASADGYVRSEGSGMLVLKRLSDALRDGDRIHAVVRGSATNQDGSSGGLTVPSGPAQEEVIRAALADGGVQPSEVGYIEAHGTGTKLGDPVEIGALGNVFCKEPRPKPLVVGSVKTNMGHLESSAGISALIKTIMMLKHGEIPPHINFQTPNPHIPWDRLAMELPLERRPWTTAPGESRIAGISSFGFSGTNVHVVLEAFDAEQSVYSLSPPAAAEQPCLLALSAKNPEALKAMAARAAAWLETEDEAAWLDLCYNHNLFRATFNYRAAITGDNAGDLLTGLAQLAQGRGAANVFLSDNLNWDGPTKATDDDAVSLAVNAFMAGKTGALAKLNYGSNPQKRDLPTYPFQHQIFPFQVDENAALQSPRTANVHPLLGRPLNAAGHAFIFESPTLSRDSGYLGDHRIGDRTLFPGAAFLETALAAGRQVLSTQKLMLTEVAIREALVLDQPRVMQTVLRPKGDGYAFQMFSRAADQPEQSWTEHMAGTLAVAETTADPTEPWQAEAGQRQGTWYEDFANQGLHYGPAFQTLRAVACEGRMVYGEVAVDGALEGGLCDPRLLDGCFQLVQLGAQQQQPDSRYVPVAIERFTRFGGDTQMVTVKAEIREITADHLKADLRLHDAEGRVLVAVEGIVGARLRDQAGRATSHALMSHIQWQPQTLQNEEHQRPRSLLLLAPETDPLAQELTRKPPHAGDVCLHLMPGEHFENRDGRTFLADLGNRDQVARVLDHIEQSGHPPLHDVVLLPGLSSGDDIRLAEDGALTAVTVAQVLAGRTQTPPRVWFVSHDAVLPAKTAAAPFTATWWGLRRVLDVEAPTLQATCLDLTAADSLETQAAGLRKLLSAADEEPEAAWRSDQRLVPRLTRGPQRDEQALFRPAGAAVSLRLEEYGNTDRLKLVPASSLAPAASEVQIEVHASGLNFRDVLHALGMLKEHSAAVGIHGAEEMPFGFECSGVVSAVGAGVDQFQVGQEVLAVLCTGSLASYVTVPAAFVIAKPDTVSHNEAATLLTTFLTALYGLETLAEVKTGDKVLIHAAAGGVGLSAVRLVQALGGEVYATASPGKWEFLRAQGVQHIMNSRTLDFAEELKTLTDGRGVDVVLNSLNGEFIDRSVASLAENGRFIEIGKLGIWSEEAMAEARPDATYHAFDLNEVSRRDPALIQTLLQQLSSRIENGDIAPLPMQVFALEQAPQAFRTMAQGKHVGKVVIEVAPAGKQAPHGEAAYLISGGQGALGLEVAAWLIGQGARHLWLIGRSACHSETTAFIERWAQRDVQVHYRAVDVTDAQAVRDCIDAVGPQPLRGVIHAAGVLDDAALDSLDREKLQRVTAAKVTGSWHLHQATAALELDFFVCFSSIAALLGNPGQANYAAANSFLDSLAAYRRTRGLAGTGINWGAWAARGMAAELEHLARLGAKALAPATALDALGTVLAEDAGQVLVADLDFETYAARMGRDRKAGLLASLLRADQPQEQAASALPERLAQTPPSERPQQMLDHIRAVAAALMGYAEHQIAVDLPLTDQGFDSLMAVELRNKLGRDVNHDLPVSLFFDYPTLEKLAVYLLDEVLGLAEAATPVTEPASEDLSGDDVLAEIEMLLD